MTNYPNITRTFMELLDLYQEVMSDESIKLNYKCKENPPGSGNFTCGDEEETGAAPRSSGTTRADKKVISSMFDNEKLHSYPTDGKEDGKYNQDLDDFIKKQYAYTKLVNPPEFSYMTYDKVREKAFSVNLSRRGKTRDMSGLARAIMKQNYKCPEDPPGSGNFKCDDKEESGEKKKYTKNDLAFETGGDAVGSEYHGYIRAVDKKTGKQVGYVDYSYYNGEWAIDMIETDKDHKRRGVATALVDRMKEDFSEGDKLTMLGTFATDEGKAFMSAKGIDKGEPTRRLYTTSWTLEMFKDPEEPRYSDDDQDLVLKSLVEEIGFDELPKQADNEELDNRIKDGDTEIFRAFSDYNAFNDFRDGDYYAGQGVHGNGIYTAKGPDAVYMANTYMRSPDAVVGRMTVDKDANIAPISKVREEFKKFEKDNPEEAKILEDVGRFATYLGYDAVDVGGDNLVVLNRGVVRVAPIPMSFDESRKEEVRRRKAKSEGKAKHNQSSISVIEDEMKELVGADDVRLQGILVDDARVILETLREESEFMPLKLKGIRTATGRKKAYMSMTQDGVLGISPTHMREQADREVGTYEDKIAEYDNAIESLQEQASGTHDLSVKGKAEALISQYKDERDQLESDRDAGVPFLPKNVGYLFEGDERIKTVLLHEIGHRRWNGLSNEDKNVVNIAFKTADEETDFPSRWSMERSDEWWAEHYAMFRMGEKHHPIIDSIMDHL